MVLTSGLDYPELFIMRATVRLLYLKPLASTPDLLYDPRTNNHDGAKLDQYFHHPNSCRLQVTWKSVVFEDLKRGNQRVAWVRQVKMKHTPTFSALFPLAHPACTTTNLFVSSG